ncbi:MAG: hypothetical protein ACYTGL_19305 [Planctomycetota bacterium]
MEYKPADPTCNPHLALAGIVNAGLHGMNDEMPLGHPLLTDTALPGDDDRARLGLAPYPASLREAVSVLEEVHIPRRSPSGTSHDRLTAHETRRMRRARIDGQRN